MKQQTLQTHKKHRGGTLVGLVVGLLVGLAMALSVAVYVTRVPVPFVDRGVSRKPSQDIEEAARNKGWNPNAQLAGKPAPLPAAQVNSDASGADTGASSVPPADGQAVPPPPAAAAATKPATPAEKPAVATATPAEQPAATPAAKPAASAAAKPAADPLGELVNARLGQSTPATSAPAPAKGAQSLAASAGADPFIYFVQAGAFKAPEDAEAQRARLAMLGMSADISEREQSGRTIYRVRVGPFKDKAMAEVTRDQLDTSGVDAALVRIQR